MKQFFENLKQRIFACGGADGAAYLEQETARAGNETRAQMVAGLRAYAASNGWKIADERIVDDIIAMGGYCPCVVAHTPSTVCPCAAHIHSIERDGRCHCGLFVKGEKC